MHNETILNTLNLLQETYKISILEDYKKVQDNLLSAILNLKNFDNCQIVASSGKETERNKIGNKENVNKVAYYFSRFEHYDLYKGSQTLAFENAAKKLKVKSSTLRNLRDRFDPYCNEIKTIEPKRSGWHQVDLLVDMQEIFDTYYNKTKQEILPEILQILELSSTLQKDDNMYFGQNLKRKQFGGKFLSHNEVENFISIVLSESTTIAKDLLDQCSQRTFKSCYDFCVKNPNLSIEELQEKIKILDTKISGNSENSLWIRARFIKEIFNNNLEQEAINLTK